MGDFSKIIENQRIKEYFLKARKMGKVSHSYILEGEKGCGKKLLAYTFARLIQCEERGEEACGRCISCIQIENRDHPDVIWVTHEKPNIISVAEVREQIVNTIDIKPYRGPYKIYIVDEAEKLRQEAQNAILKTMEEPPEYAVILLLTTNRGLLLDTIVSRAVLLPVASVTDQGLRDYMSFHYPMKASDLDFICGYSMGNIGKACAVMDSEEFGQFRKMIMTLLREIDQMNLYELGQWSENVKEYKLMIMDFLDIVTMWFRDIAVLKSTGDKKFLIFSEESVTLRNQCDILEFESLNYIFNMIEKTRAGIQTNVNPEASVELMLMQIRREFHHI